MNWKEKAGQRLVSAIKNYILSQEPDTTAAIMSLDILMDMAYRGFIEEQGLPGHRYYKERIKRVTEHLDDKVDDSVQTRLEEARKLRNRAKDAPFVAPSTQKLESCFRLSVAVLDAMGVMFPTDVDLVALAPHLIPKPEQVQQEMIGSTITKVSWVVEQGNRI